jgi:hypothetical protein
MGDTARAATPRAQDHGGHRARRPPGARTPSRSAQTDRPQAAGGTRAVGRERSPRQRPGRAESRTSRARYRGERLPHLSQNDCKRLAQDGGTSDHHQRRPRRGDVTRGTIRLAQPAPRAITLHGQAQLATHGEANTYRVVRFSPEHDERRTVDPLAPLEERLEFGAGGQSLMSRKAATQTVNRLRPFARRRFNTLRPPFVFIRSRNPCVFARRRRLG